MKIFKDQRGIAVFETILLLVIVAIIAFAGYKVFSTKKSVDESNANISASQSASSLKSEEPKELKTTGDLNKTEKVLDDINPDDTAADTNQLDNQAAGF